MAKIDNALNRSKTEGSATFEVSDEMTLVASTEQADIYKTNDADLLIYSSKASEKEKLANILADKDIELVSLSSGKPIILMHSKYGAMSADVSISPASASKILKSIDLPFLTTVAKGDGGTIMSIEKVKQATSCIDLIERNLLSLEAAAFLWTAIEGKVKPLNILIVGSGAERFEALNALSGLIPLNQRVGVVKSTIHSSHWNLFEMPFNEALVKASEMKFDRIIGEIQTKDSWQLNLLCGKTKALLSMHGSNSFQAINALKANGASKSINAIDLVLTVHSTNSGLQISEISEVINGGIKPLYLMEHGNLVQVKLESELVKHGVYLGLSARAINDSIGDKIKQLDQWMQNNIRTNTEIRKQLRA